MKNRPVIGIRLPPWTNSIWYILGGIVDYLKNHEAWRLVTEDDSYGEMEQIKIGIGWKGDGVILFRATYDELEYFKQNSIAVCLLSSEGPDGGFPRVIPNNLSIGDLAARHMLETGTQSFGFIARGETLYMEKKHAPGERHYSRARLKGYMKRLKANGFEPSVFYLKGYPLWKKDTWQKIEADIASYIKTLPKNTGLFCADDPLASAVLRVAEKQNILVPRDLMVLGFGNTMKYCHSSTPSMSSIVYPAKKIGFEAARIIAEQLANNPRLPNVVEIPIDEIKERESTSFIAFKDTQIAALVKWIRLKAPTEAIQVADLQDHTEYSLSSIKLKFKKYLGHSPKEEIKRVRLERLESHLKDVSKSLTVISEEMDFRSPEEMSRFFLREKGIRPSKYRQLPI